MNSAASIIEQYSTITLQEMKGVKLMNRTDTKFVTTVDKLAQLLKMAVNDYRVQTVDGLRAQTYYTLYFDTPRHDMFLMHQNGHAFRQKVRIRTYLDSRLSFLEIKTKDNHKRTRKKRTALNAVNQPRTFQEAKAAHDNKLAPYAGFLASNLRLDHTQLVEQLENSFKRITLVNNHMTERLTIDTQLRFLNLENGRTCQLPSLAIIEIKRDSRTHSPMLEFLRQLRIKPMGFSKYCMGCLFTNPALKRNRFKVRLHDLHKLQESA